MNNSMPIPIIFDIIVLSMLIILIAVLYIKDKINKNE